MAQSSKSGGARPGLAVVTGAGGGIGAAVLRALRAAGAFAAVRGYGRGSVPPLELEDEQSIRACAADVVGTGLPLALVVDATGFLHDERFRPEKAWRELDPAHMARAFAVNSIGPALLMKHFLPLLDRDRPAVFATLSARVGSIGDNRLGGWYSYRASKAALNQLVRTAAIELRRMNPDAVCVVVHPGTVDTALSAPFAKAGLRVQSPEEAAARLLELLGRLGPADSGSFFDQAGQRIPW